MTAARYRLRLTAEIQPSDGSGFLRVEEQAELEAEGFLEVAQVLGRFHELAQTLKTERAKAAAEHDRIMRGG